LLLWQQFAHARLFLLLEQHSAIGILGTMFTLYTVPLTLASQLFSSDQLENIFPGLRDYSEEQEGFNPSELISGMITAGIWSSFFATCPVIFKVRLSVK
jgi:hypothetical protein